MRQPPPADKLVNETWGTRLSTKTDRQGRISFRGFYGEYEITLEMPDGRTRVFPVHVGKKEENAWVFTLG